MPLASRAPRAAALLALLALVPRPSHAQEDFNLTLVHTSIAESRINNQDGQPDNDNYGVFINRTNLNGSAYGLSTQLRIDTETFIDRPNRRYKNDLRLERLQVQYQWNDFLVTGGDFFKQLGRGIMLSLRKEDEIGMDTALRGGQIEYRGADHELAAFAGKTNPSQLDTVSQRYRKDFDDLMAGGSYTFHGIDGMSIGAHALYLRPRISIDEDVQDWTQSAGAWAQIDVLDWLSLYAEGAWQLRSLVGKEEQGHAEYLAADIHLGGFSILAEAISLAEFEIRGSPNQVLQAREAYNRPPTLQRIAEQIFDNRDVIAGRLRVAYFIEGANLQLYANGLLRYVGMYEELRRGGTRSRVVQQIHGWGGAEWIFGAGGGRLNASGGYRHETQGGEPFKTLVHTDVDFVLPLGEGYSLHLAETSEYRTLVPDADWWRGSVFLGFERAGVGSLTFEFGWDDERTGTPDNPIATVFFAAILGARINQHLNANFTVGTQRGGLKCIDGICRVYPGFAGLRGELVGRW